MCFAAAAAQPAGLTCTSPRACFPARCRLGRLLAGALGAGARRVAPRGRAAGGAGGAGTRAGDVPGVAAGVCLWQLAGPMLSDPGQACGGVGHARCVMRAGAARRHECRRLALLRFRVPRKAQPHALRATPQKGQCAAPAELPASGNCRSCWRSSTTPSGPCSRSRGCGSCSSRCSTAAPQPAAATAAAARVTPTLSWQRRLPRDTPA